MKRILLLIVFFTYSINGQNNKKTLNSDSLQYIIDNSELESLKSIKKRESSDLVGNSLLSRTLSGNKNLLESTDIIHSVDLDQDYTKYEDYLKKRELTLDNLHEAENFFSREQGFGKFLLKGLGMAVVIYGLYFVIRRIVN